MECWTMKDGKQVPLEGEELMSFCRSTLATDRNLKRWAKVDTAKRAEVMEKMRKRISTNKTVL